MLPEYRVIDALVYALQKGSTHLTPFSELLGTDLCGLFNEKLSAFAEAGYLTVNGDKITLTRDGVFFGNNIISELIGIITAN